MEHSKPAAGVNADSHDRDVAQLTAWLQDHLGCTDVTLKKQRRWRPIWNAEATQNGVRRKFMLKGDRTWPTHPYPLDYEMRMQRALYENGVPIPEILGMCPDPNTMVMEWIEGGREAGLMTQAIEDSSVMTDDRWQASLRYMELLAQMHRIPPEPFVAAGAVLPVGERELALNHFERFHPMTVAVGATHPLLEFALGWMRRNVPKGRSTISFLTGDCGQFMSDGPNLTCMMDVEIGHLGDPMRDLACFRGRHPFENMGDIPALYRHYEQAMGVPNDYDALAYYTVGFLAEAIYGPFFGMHQTARGGDWVESAIQVAVIGRRTMEALSEILGITLDAIELPDPEPTPIEDLAFDKLIADLKRLPENDELPDWQRNIVASIPAYLRNHMHYRNWAQREDLIDVAQVVGAPVRDANEANTALLEFVAAAGPEQDAALTRLFHRMALRQCLIIAGPNAPDHLALTPTDPILHLKEG